jgi:hypothetical protein
LNLRGSALDRDVGRVGIMEEGEKAKDSREKRRKDQKGEMEC